MTLLLTLFLALQVTGDLSDRNSWEIENIKRNVDGITTILQQIQSEEAVAHENRLTTLENARTAQAATLAKHEANWSWLLRGIVGAVVFGAVALGYRQFG